MKEFVNGLIALVVVLFLCSVVIFSCTFAARPFQIVDKVLSTENVIDSYRMFFNMKANIESSIANVKMQQRAIEEIEQIYELKDENNKIISLKLNVIPKDILTDYRMKRDGLIIMISQLNEQIAYYNNKSKDMSIGLFNGTACKSISLNSDEECIELPQTFELFK